ncbi:hypothetical protein [Enterobacter cloacae]|uniref:Uncharacterized protein n=1 Tax=Enterobacter cloacae TaxID=550 RepID=A0A144I525_ENTCL|nr:hypothetical protein [Enterobacter cloacae]CZV11442.1 Uncharacterised protein [Enterobacter cloacae]SAG43590.1 Uncharacterised protein [Enterobacter cloacae]
MYYSKEIIERIGSDKDLAVRLDRAVAGVKDGAREYLNNLGDATTRLLYYTSCFTDNYQDVCKRLGSEDQRFLFGIIQLIKKRDLIFRIIKIYIMTLFKNKSENEIRYILEKVTPFTSNYSVRVISKNGLIYAVASYICYGNKMNTAVQNALMKKIANKAGWGLAALNAYAIVQHAADSANNLKNYCPQFYHALYMENLEMMYFLVEPVIMKSGYLNINTASSHEIIDALNAMMK